MKASRWLIAILLICAPSVLAQTLSIRLVEAHNRSNQVDASLADVAEMLKRNLPYTGFRQLGAATAELPAGQNCTLNGYTVEVSGPATACTIKISKGGKQLLSTQASLKGNTPLIVGGFPANGGKHLFVLKLK